MRASLLLVCILLVGCDQYVTVTAPDASASANAEATSTPDVVTVTVIDPAPAVTTLIGPPSDANVPFNADDASDPPCEKPGQGSGNGNGKGQGDTRACK